MTKKKDVGEESQPMMIRGEMCPFCNNKTLNLTEYDKDIPYFGKTFLFSMDCDSCGYHKADLEADEVKDPCKQNVALDLQIRNTTAPPAN